jgi:hypothetical protein
MRFIRGTGAPGHANPRRLERGELAERTRKRLEGNVARLVAIVGGDPT